MNTLALQVEDQKVLSALKKVLKAKKRVVILPQRKTSKCGLDEALDDVRNGWVTEYEGVD